MSAKAVSHLPIIKVNNETELKITDSLAVEEPLEVRLAHGLAGERKIQNISVTMRTPGDDGELAAGFLFTEGIIKQYTDISSIGHDFMACSENKENVILVSLKNDAQPNLNNTERNFYTTSSCGVCGKASISAIRTVSSFNNEPDENKVDADLLHRLPLLLKKHQEVFADTGGLHASALFNHSGELLLVKEDVGRHNALDKLIGSAFTKNMLPLNKYILLLSGRISFELVQKAAMAGINILAAVGAPSSLAVQLAEEFKITLVGFLRNQGFNIYTQPQRILLKRYEDSY